MGSGPGGGERLLGHCDFFSCGDTDILKVCPASAVRTDSRQVHILEEKHFLTPAHVKSCPCYLNRQINSVLCILLI